MEQKQIQEILSHVDHTLLRVDSTWDEIRRICDDGMKYQTASVCIPASFVKQAAEYVQKKLTICTVIGFPNGYSTTATKCAEAADAVENGADEIDMVINVGWVKEGRYSDVLSEINAVKAACQGRLLKVIIETCLLTEEEIIAMCKVVSESDAEYIKTSTGFSTAGATFDVVKLMAEHVTEGTLVKAAGGISSLEDAERFLELGASRLGTSKVVAAVKALG
jgi:deoxyribose-phosphate aldolase